MLLIQALWFIDAAAFSDELTMATVLNEKSSTTALPTQPLVNT